MIKKITIQIGKKEIDLTLDEARKLKQDLESCFNEKRVEYVPCQQPITTTTWPKYPYDIWYTTKDSSLVQL